jgi:hypothetical protein
MPGAKVDSQIEDEEGSITLVLLAHLPCVAALEHCSQCAGTLKIIAAIEHPGDYQDPHAPRLVRPGTAAIPGDPVSAPEPTPFGPSPRR